MPSPTPAASDLPAFGELFHTKEQSAEKKNSVFRLRMFTINYTAFTPVPP